MNRLLACLLAVGLLLLSSLDMGAFPVHVVVGSQVNEKAETEGGKPVNGLLAIAEVIEHKHEKQVSYFGSSPKCVGNF